MKDDTGIEALIELMARLPGLGPRSARRARSGDDILFGAAAIGHHRIGTEIRRNARHDLRHLPDRAGDQHQIGIRDVLPGIRSHPINDA